MLANFIRCILIIFIMFVSASNSYGQNHMSNQTKSVAPLLIQDSMNVFRRFKANAHAMYDFYGKTLGFKQLMTFNVGGTTGVARFQVGDSQVKLTGVVPNRTYHRGEVRDATGVRMLTFFFTDQHALEERFRARGLSVPAFKPVPGKSRSHALVKDPDGQWVELVIVSPSEASVCKGIEIGLVVSDLAKSRAFYRGFVGLEELPPEDDPLLKTKKYPFRHGSTIISLRCFGSGLPADTGSGGIQYVVSDADAVDKMARERNIVIEQPLSTLPGFALRTIWLDDPDGITNYFAQVGVKEKK